MNMTPLTRIALWKRRAAQSPWRSWRQRSAQAAECRTPRPIPHRNKWHAAGQPSSNHLAAGQPFSNHPSFCRGLSPPVCLLLPPPLAAIRVMPRAPSPQRGFPLSAILACAFNACTNVKIKNNVWCVSFLFTEAQGQTGCGRGSRRKSPSP